MLMLLSCSRLHGSAVSFLPSSSSFLSPPLSLSPPSSTHAAASSSFSRPSSFWIRSPQLRRRLIRKPFECLNERSNAKAMGEYREGEARVGERALASASKREFSPRQGNREIIFRIRPAEIEIEDGVRDREGGG